MKIIPITLINRSALELGSDQVVRTDADTPSTEDRKNTASLKPTWGSSALKALLSTRSARQQKAVQSFGIQCGVNGAEDAESLCISLELDYKGPGGKSREIPLGWTLSSQARNAISDQLKVEPDDASGGSPGIKGSTGETFPSFDAIARTIATQIGSETKRAS